LSGTTIVTVSVKLPAVAVTVNTLSEEGCLFTVSTVLPPISGFTVAELSLTSHVVWSAAVAPLPPVANNFKLLPTQTPAVVGEMAQPVGFFGGADIFGWAAAAAAAGGSGEVGFFGAADIFVWGGGGFWLGGASWGTGACTGAGAASANGLL
jgi:hypothetical protein